MAAIKQQGGRPVFSLDGAFAGGINLILLKAWQEKIKMANIFNPFGEGRKKPGMKVWKIAIIGVSIVCLLALGVAFAKTKVGGGDIKFEAKGSGLGPVIFSHDLHVTKYKLKCTDCHTKIFKMKKGGDNITQAAFEKGKFCGTSGCHDGKKAFSAVAKADCNKCHLKGK
jgi:c(7)-type cytochrome triheme protein